MIIEKTIYQTWEFPDDDIERIADRVRENYDEREARAMIDDVVCGWDDYDYYTWDSDETDKVLEEVKRRVGGVQIKMELE